MWDEDKPEKAPDKREQELKLFAANCQRILNDPDNEAFRNVLLKIAYGSSFSPGGEEKIGKTAWNEGRRALATNILYQGGVI